MKGTAPTYTEDAIHAAVVEIFVEKNAKCRYTTIQNWSSDVYNLVTKRAIVEENGLILYKTLKLLRTNGLQLIFSSLFGII